MSFKNLEAQEDGDDLCRNLNMDGLTDLGNGNDMLDCETDQAWYQFEDGDVECLLMGKNLSASETSGPIENAIEVSLDSTDDLGNVFLGIVCSIQHTHSVILL